MASCSGHVVQFVLVAVNLLWLALGCVLVYFSVQDFTFTSEMKLLNQPTTGGWLLLGVGASIFILAFLGCYGACSQSSSMLQLYGLALVALVAVEVAAGYYVYKNKDSFNVDVQAKSQLHQRMEEYSKDHGVQKLFDQMQRNLKCCGVDSPNDWQRIRLPVPPSCCDDGDQSCLQRNADDRTGCFQALKDKFNNLGGGLAVTIIAVLVQLLLAMMACCLARDY